MSVADIVNDYGITEILHFTTNHGLVGILDSGAVKSRATLPTEKSLEHVYSPNCRYRKDTAHLDYVNLSITAINLRLFGISSEKWHADEEIWWAILVFDPVILSHDGVLFATTNNMYTGVRRAEGREGLEALFAERITRWAGSVVVRPQNHPRDQTTCPQAEVLYPNELPIEHLRRIYVRNDENAAMVEAQLELLHVEGIEVVVDASVFG